MALYPHTLGVDLGQSADYTALCILEEAYWLTEDQAWQLALDSHGWVFASRMVPGQVDSAWSLNLHEYGRRPPNAPLALRHLERVELGTSYPAIVERIGELLATPPIRLAATPLVVDATGVGAPVVDMLKQAGLGPTAVTITAGFTPRYDPEQGSFSVPKRDLVTTVAVLLEQRRLLIPPDLPNADLLTRELQAFRRKITPVGSDTYAAGREGPHDDLVLCVALAAWYREFKATHIEQAHAQYHGSGVVMTA